MAEIVITPDGPEAVLAGTFVDDAGERFVGLTYDEPGKDHVIVTFTLPLFRNYVAYLGTVLAAAEKETGWAS